MAGSSILREIKLRFEVDGGSSADLLAEIRSRMDEVRDSYEELKRKQQAGGLSSEEFKRNEKELRKMKNTLDDLEKEQEKLTGSMRTVERTMNNLSGATINNLKKALTQAVKDVKNLKRGTAEYEAALAKAKVIQEEYNKAMEEMNDEMGETRGRMGGVVDGFNKYFGIVTAGLASITGITYSFRKLAEQLALMDDVYADVMKTTGMAQEEVAALNDEFKRILINNSNHTEQICDAQKTCICARVLWMVTKNTWTML